ncbi:MAG: response regulator [Nitrospira sp. BO4]|nr:response regulator [Nitrospira sp. BO4]
MTHPPFSNLPKGNFQGLPSDLAFLSGGGEMGGLIRSKDWSKTPLGPADRWPQSLKTAVRIMLTSRQPIWLGWGEQLIKLYNDPYKAIVCGKHPAALGQPASVVWREIWPEIGPMLRKAMGGIEGTYVESQLLIMERNGYPEETYYTFSYSPIPDDQGGVGGIFCANTDDTDRMIGERQLTLLKDLAARTAHAQTFDDACRLSAVSLQNDLHDFPFALIYLAEQEGNRFVPAASSGIEPNPIATAGPALDAPSVWPLAQVIRTQKPSVITDLPRLFDHLPTGAWKQPPHKAVVLPIIPSGKTGKAGVLIVGLNPYRLFDDRFQRFVDLVVGQIAASIANAQRYEEERQRAEALAELDRAKTAFFSNVSHELRTPLTLMLGPLEDLKAQFGRSTSSLDASQYQQVDVVHRNGLRLLKLVNQLLDFSRIEAGRVQAVYEETDLAEFTADLASVFRSTMEKGGLSLIVDCPPLPEPVFVDRDMWEKIVLNLLSNAFKYTLDGEIQVTLRPSGKHVELSIRDTGTGIPEDQLGKIFERFHRIAGSQGRTYEGTGIGLSLVQELAHLHGGSISVESMYGKGSTFRVFIPLGKNHLPHKHIGITERKTAALGAMSFVEEATRLVPSASEAGKLVNGTSSESDDLSRVVTTDPSLTTRSRVLLADDNTDMREYVSRLLKERYEVIAVADGQAALEAVRRNPPDLILSDVMMPRLDGFGLLRALRADPVTKAIPIILLSARAGEESRVEGLEHGADDYLIKPFSARELLARVQVHLDMVRIRQEAAETLRHSERRFRELLDGSPFGMYIVDTQLRIVHMNESSKQGAFRNVRPVIGRDFSETMRILWPETVAADIIAAFRHTLETGQPYSSRDFINLRADVNQVEGYEWELHRLTLPDGQPGVICYYYDSTRLRQTEAALRESEQRLQRVLETDAVGVLFFNRNGTLLQANDVFLRMTGYERERIERREITWRTMTPPEWVEASENQMKQFVETGRIGPYEKEYFLADGTRRWMLFAGRDLGDGTIAEYCVDIHDRKQAEQALREAQERLQRWNVELEKAVKFKTVELQQSQERLRALTSELNLAEQRERKRLATELHDHLQQVLVYGKMTIGQGRRSVGDVSAALKLIKKVEDVFSEALTYTRTLVAELSPPVLRYHGLAAGLKWLADYMKKHDQTVSVRVPDSSVPQLPEDQAILLFQSVRELLINASKHAGTGEAAVTMTQLDDALEIVVRDEGSGFNVAEAVGADTPSGGISSKFGLFSIQERMRALGGSFIIQSTPGQGTTATLALPLLHQDPEARKDLNAEANGKASPGHDNKPFKQQPPSIQESSQKPCIRVLLVDDHTMMRQGLRTILAGYADIEVVGEATNGEEAVELVDRLSPDVVVMDLNMPKMDGIEATRLIKTSHAQVQVVGLSVNTGREAFNAFTTAGAWTLLTKEAAVERLYGVIQQSMQVSVGQPKG